MVMVTLRVKLLKYLNKFDLEILMASKRINSKISFISCIGDVNDTHTIKYINTLLESGYQIETIRTGEGIQQGFKHHRLPDITSNFWPTGLSVINLLSAIYQRIRNSFYLVLKLFKTKPDIVVATEPDSWFISILCKPFVKYKIVADIREVYEDRIDGFPKWFRKPGLYMLKKFMKFSSRYTNEIIHVSEERQKVYAYLMQKGKVIVYYPDLNNDVQSDTSTTEDFIVIHAGALREKYGANQIIDAFSIIGGQNLNIKLYVLGGTAGKITNQHVLDELVSKGGVKLINQVPYEIVLEYLGKSKIGLNIVLPVDQSHYLAQPRKLYEYLSRGLPFVAAKVPTVEKVKEKWNNGIVVDPYSAIEIANAIIYYFQHDEARKIASMNAMTSHVNEYNWESQKGKFVEIFNELSISKN